MQSILQLRSVYGTTSVFVAFTTILLNDLQSKLPTPHTSIVVCLSFSATLRKLYVTWFKVDHSAPWLVDQGSKNCSFTSCSSGSNATIYGSAMQTTSDTYRTLFILCSTCIQHCVY